MFRGGGAVTHAALLSGKYKQFVANDIDGRLVPFFLDCCHGKYTTENHKEWISREDFFKNIDDIYTALVWSFGNNGRDYLYSKERESFKKAMHYACFFGDTSLLQELGVEVPEVAESKPYERYRAYQAYFRNEDTRMNELERLQSLEGLENLYRLQSLQSLQSDYVDAMEKVNRQYAEKDILIYADPPYNATNCGKYQGFDSDRFYEWAREQDNIFISEYQMPDDFIPYAWTEKTVLSAARTNAIKSKEIVWTNQRTYDKLNDKQKLFAQSEFSKQMTLEDYL